MEKLINPEENLPTVKKFGNCPAVTTMLPVVATAVYTMYENIAMD